MRNSSLPHTIMYNNRLVTAIFIAWKHFVHENVFLKEKQVINSQLDDGLCIVHFSPHSHNEQILSLQTHF